MAPGASENAILSSFHPVVQQWFASRFSAPTPVQSSSWEAISQGKNALICAPTGQGKTLAAFLWVINNLIQENHSGRVLYISPLKALNTDISRNLKTPLDEIRMISSQNTSWSGEVPQISIGLRSGDSSSRERAAIMRHPPDIFITTPESLNIMLTSEGGRKNLSDISTVILDEIHLLAGSKRGTLLMANLERLQMLCNSAGGNNFQRIGISATIRPLDRMADFLSGTESSAVIIEKQGKREIDLSIALGEPGGEGWWDRQVPLIAGEIREHRTTLIFCNSRRMAEKTASLLNEYFGEKTVFAHHGSLSREYRQWVEEELKAGRLQAIAATSSLELGIDIGTVDRVIQLQSPFSVSSAVQRVGRANHQVDGISSALFAPLHPRDILRSLAVIEEIHAGRIEEIHIPESSTDILAQLILSECAGRRVKRADLFTALRRSYPFRNLDETLFDQVIGMLGGKYQNSRIPELGQRIVYDRHEGWLEGRSGLSQLIYQSGGTIPDRGYFELRIGSSGEKIGELDEEFVFERSLGDRFSFGNRVWQVDSIDNRQMMVSPTTRSPMLAPFWKADGLGSGPWLSQAINRILSKLQENTEAYLNSLPDGLLNDQARSELCSWIASMKALTDQPLPSSKDIIIERLSDPSLTPDLDHFIIHSGWGVQVHAPLMYCLRDVFHKQFGFPLQSFYGDSAIVCSVPIEYANTLDLPSMIEDLRPDQVSNHLSSQLLGTGLFGARFRANAGRSLLVVRKGFNQRSPLWLQRMKSKQLLERILEEKEFPIIRETWRELLHDEFSLDFLAARLEDISEGRISIQQVATDHPSPFAGDLMWDLNNEYLYKDDSLESTPTHSGNKDLVSELSSSSIPIPEISDELVNSYLEKRRRTHREYLPVDEAAFRFYIHDRRIMSTEELTSIQQALGQQDFSPRIIVDKYLRSVTAIPEGREIYIHRDLLDESKSIHPNDIDSIILEWFEWQGFVDPGSVYQLWGETAVGNLIGENALIETSQGLILPDVLERLIRYRRNRKRNSLHRWSASEIQLEYALLHNILILLDEKTSSENSSGAKTQSLILSVLESLTGCFFRPDLFVNSILPARLRDNLRAELEKNFQESGYCWTGSARGVGIVHMQDFHSYYPTKRTDDSEDAQPVDEAGSAPILDILDQGGGYRLDEIILQSGLPQGTVVESMNELLMAGRIFSDSLSALERWPQLVNLAHRGDSLGESQRPSNPLQMTFRQRRELFRKARQTRLAPGVRSIGSIPGRWYSTKAIPGFEGASHAGSGDPENQLNQQQLKVSQLLTRHVLISRQSLNTESSAFSWSDLLPVLRNLELGGELIGGKISEELEGLQFCDRQLRGPTWQKLPGAENKTGGWFWLNSYDPALLLPHAPLRKSDGTFYLFMVRNSSAVLSAGVCSWGRELYLYDQYSPASEPDSELRHSFARILALFYRETLPRRSERKRANRLEQIDQIQIADSPWVEFLKEAGFQSDHKGLRIWKF